MIINNRINQFLKATQSEIYAEEVPYIRKHLSKQEQILFYRMPVYDQRHCLDVAYRLHMKIKAVEKRQKHPVKFKREAINAALLHDVGKIEIKYSVWMRSLYVLVRKMFFNFGWKFLLQLGRKPTSLSLFRSLYVLEFHPLIGADMLQKISGDPYVIKTVAAHQDDIDLSDPIVINLLKESDMQT